MAASSALKDPFGFIVLVIKNVEWTRQNLISPPRREDVKKFFFEDSPLIGGGGGKSCPLRKK